MITTRKIRTQFKIILQSVKNAHFHSASVNTLTVDVLAIVLTGRDRVSGLSEVERVCKNQKGGVWRLGSAMFPNVSMEHLIPCWVVVHESLPKTTSDEIITIKRTITDGRSSKEIKDRFSESRRMLLSDKLKKKESSVCLYQWKENSSVYSLP